MAAKKEEQKIVLERTYTIPLRREFLKVPRWKRTKKAVIAVRQFLSRHMKSETVKLKASLNQELWKRGIRNPPHHVKVTARKDSEGIVDAELFGATKEVLHKEKVIQERKQKGKDAGKRKKEETAGQLEEEIKEQEEQIKGEELEGGTPGEEIRKEKGFVKKEKEEVKELEKEK